jgi:vacuolar protein sorting-associated protein 13A/C
MVFESVVANVLNTFLGDYVADLETQQLNIGIWGGDVKLHNLKLKREALDKFNLPINIKSGMCVITTSHRTRVPW